MKIHNLGFPRIGKHRQLKFALEKYWQQNDSAAELLSTARQLREQHWQLQQQAGIELLPVGDFAHYDHVLNTSLYLGVIPERFQQQQGSQLDLEFSIARGQTNQCSCAASDMTKWFNTNYHYIVPELRQDQEFEVDIKPLLEQIQQAKKLCLDIKPQLLGPVTYLWLANYAGEDKLTLLPALLQAYQQILQQLDQQQIEWLQIDEPILGLELEQNWQQAIQQSYTQLNKGKLKLLLTSYFASIEGHMPLIAKLNIDGLHLDLVSEVVDVEASIKRLPKDWIISLGIINGRNIWRSDLHQIYQQLLPLYQQLGERLWLAPSCSLLHSPVDLKLEQKLDPEIKSWLAFAVQKCEELQLLKQALVKQRTTDIIAYSQPVLNRLSSPKVNNASVQARVSAINAENIQRSAPFAIRKQAQQQHLDLPLFPTTSIGSFPQTTEIRRTRSLWRKGELKQHDYEQAIKQEIRQCIKRQEQLGLDVLVHGEPERNDMVEYFGELLQGFAITEFAWVQSYGSRCVKPPIIYGDISRTQAMTTKWLTYAQAQTDKPVKGMLTGPVTILCWSFVRDDLERKQVALQIALAVSDEIQDLVHNNIHVIQVDEPAIREGMPLKQSQWQEYLDWACSAFRLSCAKAPARTQIHSHMCYSEFNEIMSAIIALDADVLTIETSRSNMALLEAFKHESYPNDLGPGVYDIHSPNVPTQEWILTLLNKARETLPDERLWVNPDCGLKTRTWKETESALSNMVQAAQQLRKSSS